jgi:ubiquinone/menaquinone biosynthesis C-methylase UbiE
LSNKPPKRNSHDRSVRMNPPRRHFTHTEDATRTYGKAIDQLDGVTRLCQCDAMKHGVDLSGIAFGDVDQTGNAAHFISYLDEATNQFKPLKKSAHSLLQLRPNERVLDVGCGSGDDVRELAAMVAPNGCAVGIDKSSSMIEEARRRARDCPLPLQFELGEAVPLPWQSNQFDACRADRLFCHLVEPESVLNEMIRVLKPRGRLVVVDRDWGMVAIDSADSVTTQTVVNRACDGIRNGLIGRKLHGLFRRAGLIESHVEAHTIPITKFYIANTLLDLDIVTEHAIREQRITRQAADAWLNDLRERDQLRTFFATLTLYVGFGRKP